MPCIWESTQLCQRQRKLTEESSRCLTKCSTQPQQRWCSDRISDAEECCGEQSQDSDKFYFRLVPSPMAWEALCYKAPSTIGKEAGNGLFLKRHYKDIPKGKLSNSSRSYVLSSEVSGAHVLYNAELETGNNLARFANQPGVLEALEETVQLSDKNKFPEMNEEDWRNINKIVESHCNAVYSKKGDTMVLLAKDNIPPNSNSMEIFASYGDMREYWVKAIAESPSRFTVTRQMGKVTFKNNNFNINGLFQGN